MKNTQKTIWIFHSAGARSSGGVFNEVSLAEAWISKHNLTGVLTEYPINCGAYEWAIENDMFTPKNDKHTSPTFIGGFTSASQVHYHYENGAKA